MYICYIFLFIFVICFHKYLCYLNINIKVELDDLKRLKGMNSSTKLTGI